MNEKPGATEPGEHEPGQHEPTEVVSLRSEADYAPAAADETLAHETPTEPAAPAEPAEPAEPTEPEAARRQPEPEPEPVEPAVTEPVAAAPPGFPPPPPGGGFPPPPGYPPPPPGGGFPPPPPPPPAGGFASRYGLVRPRPGHGRVLAGVCAAIGRATNTDPVLWRVLLAVLTIFGGVGLLIYLLGWLLIPAEGDTASAAEALLGRGHSSTSAAAVIIAAVLIALLLITTFSGGAQSALLGLAVIAGAVLLLFRGGNLGRAPAPPPSSTSGYPGLPDYPGMTAPTAAPSTTAPSTTAPATGPVTAPAGATVPMPPGYEPTAGYRPPFAPHGPYASSSPYAASLGYPSAPPPAYPGLGGVAVAEPPPRPPRPRSRLGRVTLSLLLVAIGVLAVADVSGANVRGMGYVAVALGTIGFGLIVGAWFGRARYLIAPGLILAAVLNIGGAVQDWTDTHPQRTEVWQPTSVAEINPSYHLDVGSATLDLSRVDFTEHTVTIDVSVDVGNLVVILPPKVDANVDVSVDLGDATVFGDHVGGADRHRSVTDKGIDGPGGGQVDINATVNLGKLVVNR